MILLFLSNLLYYFLPLISYRRGAAIAIEEYVPNIVPKIIASMNHLIATGQKKNIARRVINTVNDVRSERVRVSLTELLISAPKSILFVSLFLRLVRIRSMITMVSLIE